ncbi:MAG: hypothetical protein R2735_11110 [Microthrixaceae bacterium]
MSFLLKASSWLILSLAYSTNGGCPMLARKIAISVITAATVALAGCGFYADSSGQTCVILLGIPVCQASS